MLSLFNMCLIEFFSSHISIRSCILSDISDSHIDLCVFFIFHIIPTCVWACLLPARAMVSLNFQQKIHSIHGPRRGGGGESRRSPPMENQKRIPLNQGLFCCFLSMWPCPFGYVFLLFTMWGPSYSFFYM